MADRVRTVPSAESGSKILNDFRAAMEQRRLGKASAPGGRYGARMYAAARNSRLTVGFGSSGNSSADAELKVSLTPLRSRSRQMVRDSSYARRARLLVVNNVIGGGVGLQSQVKNTRDKLNERVNRDIEAAWTDWCCAESCHTGGALHFADLERMAMGQVFEAGEIIIRKHYRAFGGSRVPLALEIIEAERLADEFTEPSVLDSNAEIRMGVEVDKFGRALAYWIRQRHPGDLRGPHETSDRYERVPAQDIFHLRIIDRWPQTRGEPWMHTVLRKLDDMNEYSGSEIQAARAQSYAFATIESPAADGSPLADEDDGDQQVMNIEPLMVQALAPGEKLEYHTPTRPNTALDPFMRYMLREFAAGVGPSYESISRDYSQSNYSSSRLALLDDRDLWRVLQLWWIRSFRLPLHKIWLQQAVFGGAIASMSVVQYASDIARSEAVLFKPRGWTWVDPTKEVTAYKEGVKAGFITVTDVIAQTAGGLDIEDVIATRKRELELFEEAGIKVDTTVSSAPAKPPPQSAAPPGPQVEPADEPSEDDPPRRVVSFPAR